jgi:hypothetical protein
MLGLLGGSRQHLTSKSTIASNSLAGARPDKAGLIERVGRDEGLPSLRLRLAEGLGCELARAALRATSRPGMEQCGVHYPELLTRRS